MSKRMSMKRRLEQLEGSIELLAPQDRVAEERRREKVRGELAELEALRRAGAVSEDEKLALRILLTEEIERRRLG